MFYQTLTARRPPKGPKNAILTRPVALFVLFPSNSSERGTKHVFRVNLAQIRSVVPEIFRTQTMTGPKTEPSAVDCVR